MRSFIIICILFLVMDSFAAKMETNYPTDAEIKMLPQYCHARLRSGQSTQVKYWKQTLGKDYINVHHLCAAEAFIMRSNRYDKHREFYLRSAEDNLNYMIKHAKPGFILMPDVYYQMAVVMKKKEGDKIPETITNAKKSISLNKKYLKPYLLLSDVYYDQGYYEEAEKVLNEASKYYSNKRAIKRRQKKITDKKSK